MGEHTKHSTSRVELRERIILAAVELFTTNGIKSITMDEIAASLGISKRTLYEVFPDKETLLEECILKSQKDGDIFVKGVIETSSNVLEVLLRCYQWSIERFHATYNPQIQISAESETKRSIFREKDKTKRSKKESAQHSKSRNKSFVMTSVSAL